MIISCPYCQTRYQVANDAIGAVGRKVQCANCQKAWQAMPEAPKPKLKVVPPSSPEDDRLFDDMAEEGLDEAFAAEETALAAKIEAAAEALRQQAAAKTIDEIKSVLTDDKPAPQPSPATKSPATPVDPALLRKRQRAFSQRRHSLARSLPLARVQRALRLGGAAGLVLVLGAGIALRTDIVRFAPDLAGVYSAVGLGVNVVGLDFRDMHTVRILRDGKEVMVVTATIFSTSGSTVNVPHVIVTLLDDQGRPLYEWSAASQARDLAPGEILAFETQLSAPPANTARVRLSFANSRSPAAPHTGEPVASSAAPVAEEPPPAAQTPGTEPAAHEAAPPVSTPADAGNAPQSTH